MTTAASPLACEGCGAPLSAAEASDIPRLCKDCNELVESKAPSRRHPRAPPRRSSAELRRAIPEPRACPYCLRHYAGSNLVRHMRDVHHATMTIVRDGTEWPPQPVNDL
jgi:hypothetical protein